MSEWSFVSVDESWKGKRARADKVHVDLEDGPNLDLSKIPGAVPIDVQDRRHREPNYTCNHCEGCNTEDGDQSNFTVLFQVQGLDNRHWQGENANIAGDINATGGVQKPL